MSTNIHDPERDDTLGAKENESLMDPEERQPREDQRADEALDQPRDPSQEDPTVDPIRADPTRAQGDPAEDTM